MSYTYMIIAIVVVAVCASLFRLKEKGVDPDERILALLYKHGSDFDKPHEIEFFLYFPTQDKAQAAAERIGTNGFAVTVEPGATDDSWLCFATKTMPPNLDDLQEIRRDFTVLAESLGGEYDGWVTGVQD